MAETEDVKFWHSPATRLADAAERIATALEKFQKERVTGMFSEEQIAMIKADAAASLEKFQKKSVTTIKREVTCPETKVPDDNSCCACGFKTKTLEFFSARDAPRGAWLCDLCANTFSGNEAAKPGCLYTVADLMQGVCYVANVILQEIRREKPDVQ